MPFWIDAICINQHDIPERNKQLAMMKWIYFRADTVVVWLGKKYSRYQPQTEVQTGQDTVPPRIDQDKSKVSEAIQQTTFESGEKSEMLAMELDKEDGVEARNEERQMVMDLCADGYWDRLWIVQEIGRASKKKVCLGNLGLDWNAFIQTVTLHNSSAEGPLRLNRLLQEKYSGSHTLRRLLQDHQGALCKEPRDKIYGLVGLADDAVGFPMDYGKSLIEVWTDTMEFMNRQRLLQESNLIPFGGLVKSLLIGADLGPLKQALQPHEPRPNSAPTMEDPDDSRAFQLQACLVGCIMAVGPSPAEIICSLRKADQWAAEIQQNFQGELGEAHRENDILMRYILESDEAHLVSTCFSHVSNVRWGISWDDTLGWYYSDMTQRIKSRYSVLSRPRSETSPNDTLPPDGNSHLFLIKNCSREQTPWKMGIASSLAQPGDLVCWVHGTERALILRATLAERMFQVFGTALLTADFDLNGKANHTARLSGFYGSEKLTVKMDAATIYALLA
ncbi:heterokaryon incompatibility protein-domain-containing protein [Tricladium varicosporioides]|nr:heterokaryon incompatibility protein-domain-containing protein [Hymenoscyphus varicosporioides]